MNSFIELQGERVSRDGYFFPKNRMVIIKLENRIGKPSDWTWKKTKEMGKLSREI